MPQWNDFKDNVKTAFGNLRGDTDFTDVTLACEDGQQVRAHKVILATSSPTLQKILRKNQHPQPSMIYMRGLKSDDLKAMIDFIYFGEANVFQENLDSFLALAEELQLKGLTGQDAGRADEVLEQEVKFRETVISEPKNPGHTDIGQMENDMILPRTVKENMSKTVAALTKIDTEGIEELAEKAKSLMEKTSSATPDGKRPLYVCKICGKEGQSIDVQRHIEAKHLEGAALPCNICGKTSRSRNALGEHKRTYHQTKSDQFISLSPQVKRGPADPQSKVSSHSMN